MIEKKEGFFSSLFKDKKNNQIEKENIVLQNMLDKKDRIISQLQEKVDIEAEKRKKAEVFLKQSEIIQRNLESKDKKNRELSLLVESIQNDIKTITVEKDVIFEKYTTLAEVLDETKKENTNLKETHKSLEEELISLNVLKKQGDQMQIVGDVFLSRDKMEKIQEENLSVRTLCGQQRVLIDNLEEKNQGLTEELNHKLASITDLKIRLEKSLSVKTKDLRYKLPLKKLLCATKFSDILEALDQKNIFFINDFTIEEIATSIDGIKNDKLAIGQIEDFNRGKYSWDTKTFICKGPKLSKIFSRQRKLLNYFSENYMEFLVDLESFDFDILLDYNFKPDQIETFKEKLKEYDHLKI